MQENEAKEDSCTYSDSTVPFFCFKLSHRGSAAFIKTSPGLVRAPTDLRGVGEQDMRRVAVDAEDRILEKYSGTELGARGRQVNVLPEPVNCPRCSWEMREATKEALIWVCFLLLP